jgi:CRP-like cAMP-binding protein
MSTPDDATDDGASDGRAGECNRLLLALPPEEYRYIAPLLTPLHVAVRHVIYEANAPIEHVYFPQTGVMSVTMGMTDQSMTVEVATIGREGLVGLPVFLNSDRSTTRAFGQVAGDAKRISTRDFRRVLRRGGRLPTLLLRYTQVAFSHVAQTAGCNQAHSLGQRCARWLLLTQDRVDGDRFELKQEFLGYMLGVHRPSVSVAAGLLQKAGLISYSRGRITVHDRAGLEAAACECYGIMVREYDRLLGPGKQARDRRRARQTAS